jgi:hypothetical protein
MIGFHTSRFLERGLEVIKNVKTSNLDERALVIHHQIDSVRARIADLEWTYDRCQNDEAEQIALYDDRRKAVDKLRYLQEELASVELQRHRIGSGK